MRKYFYPFNLRGRSYSRNSGWIWQSWGWGWSLCRSCAGIWQSWGWCESWIIWTRGDSIVTVFPGLKTPIVIDWGRTPVHCITFIYTSFVANIVVSEWKDTRLSSQGTCWSAQYTDLKHGVETQPEQNRSQVHFDHMSILIAEKLDKNWFAVKSTLCSVITVVRPMVSKYTTL